MFFCSHCFVSIHSVICDAVPKKRSNMEIKLMPQMNISVAITPKLHILNIVNYVVTWAKWKKSRNIFFEFEIIRFLFEMCMGYDEMTQPWKF